MNPIPTKEPLVMRRLLVPAIAGALAVLSASAQTVQGGAADVPAGHATTADGRHTLNLKDADIQALIATVSEIDMAAAWL